jgi:hypothetical protein
LGWRRRFREVEFAVVLDKPLGMLFGDVALNTPIGQADVTVNGAAE